MDIAGSSYVRQWLRECGRLDPLYPDGKGDVLQNRDNWAQWSGSKTGSFFSINEDGHLLLNTINSRNRIVRMAQFCGARRDLASKDACLLINGDGMPRNTIAEDMQTRLRNWARREIGVRNIVLVPYMALDAARVDYSSIRPIHISSETNESVRQSIEIPFTLGEIDTPKFREIFGNLTPTSNRWDGWKDGTVNGTRYRVRLFITPRKWVRDSWVDGNHNRSLQWMIQFQPPNGSQAWYRIQGPNKNPFITYQVHRLGASVFSALGPDGMRHRYLSAFDSNENPPMYFLAQLPDEGKVTNYKEAIDLLAPPIVHKARAEGRDVPRQGDIFAVETDLTDEDLKQQGYTITKREAILVVNGTKVSLKRGVTFKKAETIMIYGTGHTASQVAKNKNGTTLVRGIIFHDPHLEERGRAREHRNTQLGNGKKWFLACRNTVPRDVVVLSDGNIPSTV